MNHRLHILFKGCIGLLGLGFWVLNVFAGEALP
jgi:hypothetical protein